MWIVNMRILHLQIMIFPFFKGYFKMQKTRSIFFFKEMKTYMKRRCTV